MQTNPMNSKIGGSIWFSQHSDTGLWEKKTGKTYIYSNGSVMLTSLMFAFNISSPRKESEESEKSGNTKQKAVAVRSQDMYCMLGALLHPATTTTRNISHFAGDPY